MRNLKVSGVTLVATLILALVAVVAASVAVNGTTDNPGPAWNVYTKDQHPGFKTPSGLVQNRDESDFVRLGTKGELGNGINDEYCADGQVLDLWVYIHNGSEPEFNGSTGLDGPGVARNTTVNIAMTPSNDGMTQTVNATINASNSQSVTDDIVINCSDPTKQITVSPFAGGNVTLSTKAPDHQATGYQFQMIGDPFVEGAIVGYGASGLVPGCWEYIAVVRAQLEVNVTDRQVPEPAPDTIPEEIPEPDTPDMIPKTGADLGAIIALSLLAAVIGATGYRGHQIVKSRR